MRTPAIAGRTGPDNQLTAGLATAVVVAQVLFAPAMLVAAVALVIVGRAARWRPHWLLLPVLTALGWLLGVPVPLLQWRALAGQFPLALLLGSGEAALVLWLAWWRYRPTWRPGLVAVARRWSSARALAAGHTVTADGFALGVVAGTGKLAAVSWPEAARGVLLTGRDGDRLSELGMAATGAALRLRKAVLILDLAGVAASAVTLARSSGIPVDRSPAELGRAVRRRGAVVADLGIIELVGLLETLHERGLRADCLAWITGAERLEPCWLDRMLAVGPATGTALLFSSTSEAWATVTAPKVQLVVAEGPTQARAAQRSGEFTMIGVATPFVRPGCLSVPVTS